MTIQIVKDNIFVTGAKYIAHQANCTSTYSAGLAKEIFDRYPYSNCYKLRNPSSYVYNENKYDNVSANYSTPGTIQICGDGLKERYIINMFAQYNPGSTDDNKSYDSIKDRKKWFFECLMEIAKIDNLESIALPDRVGCGLASGNWEWYFNSLQKFSKHVERKAIVLLYKLDK